jgi:flagellar biosynthesis anti-sigma factor FlgM
MRVQGKYLQVWESLTPEKKGQRTEGPDKVSGEQDAVELSSRARLLQRAYAALTAVSKERNERIEQLRRQVEQGRYWPDTRKVADRMLDF